MDHGARILTSLEGRSRASAERARAAGMVEAADNAIAGQAEIILSIVPPGEAVALAGRLGDALRHRGGRPPLFVDCNAVSPDTVRRVQAAAGSGDADFVDAGIIGGPPRDGHAGPTFYLSGPAARRAAALENLGLRVRILPHPIGAASALKMCYGGITKGFAAIGASMVLAAARAGVSQDLHEELAASAPALAERLRTALPDMLPKAYRWVAEMEEVAAFIGQEHAESGIFTAAAALYEGIARDGDDAGASLQRFADGARGG